VINADFYANNKICEQGSTPHMRKMVLTGHVGSLLFEFTVVHEGCGWGRIPRNVRYVGRFPFSQHGFRELDDVPHRITFAMLLWNGINAPFC